MAIPELIVFGWKASHINLPIPQSPGPDKLHAVTNTKCIFKTLTLDQHSEPDLQCAHNGFYFYF